MVSKVIWREECWLYGKGFKDKEIIGVACVKHQKKDQDQILVMTIKHSLLEQALKLMEQNTNNQFEE
jgi:hypothetical protein